MDLNEIGMLQAIKENDIISQRDMSSELGISLGMVNLLIKKFVKTGLVKAERLTGNKVKYMLTPTGFSYLSKKTAEYVSKSYKAVLKIQMHMDGIIDENFQKDETVLIFGKEDEIYEILIDLLNRKGYAYRKIDVKPIDDKKFVQWQDAGEPGVFVL